MKRHKIMVWLAGAALMLAGAALVFSACEKELGEKERGEKVPVIFSVQMAGFEGDEDALRNAGGKELAAEMIPIGDDFYLNTKLKMEAEEGLRADELRALKDGQKICLSVYTTGATPDESVTYTYSEDTGKLTPDGGNPLGVVPDGTTYRFVAHSYYGDPTETPPMTNIDLEKDVVWGVDEKEVNDNETDRTVNITMAHLLARVRVRIDASRIATDIEELVDVKIEGKKSAIFTLKTGALEEDADLPAMDVTDSMEEESAGVWVGDDYQLFYPFSNEVDPHVLVKVTIGSITMEIDGVSHAPFTGLSSRFTVSPYSPLQAGRSYALVVELKENPWAHSNIYWTDADEGKLTFDKKKTNPSHADYQGVFFKWGSLVGVSPVGDSGSDVALYIPNSGAGSWDKTKTLASMDTPWGDMDLPYVTNSGITGDENYLYELSSDPATYAAYKGDICRYLGGDTWQMPNQDVFLYGLVQPNIDYTLLGFISGLPFTAGNVPTDPSGQGSIGSTAGATYTAFGYVFLPASGYRNGPSDTVGKIGAYWIGQRGYTTDTYAYQQFSNDGKGFQNWSESPHSKIRPVRCIRHNY